MELFTQQQGAISFNFLAMMYKWRSKAVRTMFWAYTKSAKKRGYSFSLTRDEFGSLIKMDTCFYCNRKAYQEQYGELVLGIDRVDNSKGYSPDNCVASCKDCNYKKGRSLVQNFLKNFINV